VLEGIQNSYLHAVSNMAMAWTSPILGDFDGALRQASVSLEELRGQDEPLWMVLAVGSAGALETVVGRYDDAFGHLRTARDLGERFDNTWLATFSRVQQGILAVEQGRLEDARAQLEGALELSMAARSTRSVTLCLAAFAQLAFAAGEPERAALLAGRPRACAGGPGYGPGRCYGGGRLSWWPSSARPWRPPTSTRSSPPASDSTSGRRLRPSATGAAPTQQPIEPRPGSQVAEQVASAMRRQLQPDIGAWMSWSNTSRSGMRGGGGRGDDDAAGRCPPGYPGVGEVMAWVSLSCCC
jgi:hypothetical protein